MMSRVLGLCLWGRGTLGVCFPIICLAAFCLVTACFSACSPRQHGLKKTPSEVVPEMTPALSLQEAPTPIDRERVEEQARYYFKKRREALGVK